MIIEIEKSTARTKALYSCGIVNWDFSKHNDMKHACTGILDSITIRDFHGTLDEAIEALTMLKIKEDSK